MIQKLHGRVVDSVVDYDFLSNIGNGINHTLIVIKLYAVLTVISEFYSFSYVPVSAVAWHNSLKHLYKCRFADAVVTDYAHAFITSEYIIEITEYHFVAKSLVYMLRFKDF